MLPSSILYLKLNKNIPRFYFSLSDKLSDFGLKLVPVKAYDLGFYIKKEKRIIFSFVGDLISLDTLSQQRSLYLDYYLKNKKVFLLDLNSFGSSKLTKNYLKGEVYDHIPLPLEVEDIAYNLVEVYKRFYGVEKINH